MTLENRVWKRSGCFTTAVNVRLAHRACACLAGSEDGGQQQEEGFTFAGAVYAAAAAWLMETIYVSGAHGATDTAENHSASLLSQYTT